MELELLHALPISLFQLERSRPLTLSIPEPKGIQKEKGWPRASHRAFCQILQAGLFSLSAVQCTCFYALSWPMNHLPVSFAQRFVIAQTPIWSHPSSGSADREDLQSDWNAECALLRKWKLLRKLACLFCRLVETQLLFCWSDDVHLAFLFLKKWISYAGNKRLTEEFGFFSYVSQNLPLLFCPSQWCHQCSAGVQELLSVPVQFKSFLWKR